MVVRAFLFGAMTPGALWSFAIGNGGGGLVPPVLKGGGVDGLNILAFGSKGFLPLVALLPSTCPSSRVTGLQLDQCWVSNLGWPAAVVPTLTLIQD